MVESFVRSTLATSWCCSGLPAPPRVCTLAAGIPDDCLDSKIDGTEEPAWFDKSRQMPSVVSKTLASEMESLRNRLHRCEKSLDRVFGLENRDGYPSAVAVIDGRTPLCRIIEDLRIGQAEMQQQLKKDHDVMQGIEDRTQSVQRQISASSAAQTQMETKLNELSAQVTDIANVSDPLEMGPQLGKSLNTCEWGALFAESKKEIAECRQRIDDLILAAANNHGQCDTKEEVRSPPHPAAEISVPLAWEPLPQNRAADVNVLSLARRQESDRQLYLMRQASASSPLSNASSPLSGGQDKWRPLPVMRPPVSRRNTS